MGRQTITLRTITAAVSELQVPRAMQQNADINAKLRQMRRELRKRKQQPVTAKAAKAKKRPKHRPRKH